MVKALADRLAEAFAEYLHEAVRKGYWGYAEGEDLNTVELVKESYKGIAPHRDIRPARIIWRS